MKRINAYETTDGQVFSDRKLAKVHQQHIDVLEALRHVAENAPRTESIDKDRLGDFLCDNAVAIEAALRGIKTSFVLPAPQVEAAPSKDDMNNLLGELADAGYGSPVNRDAEPVALAA